MAADEIITYKICVRLVGEIFCYSYSPPFVSLDVCFCFFYSLFLCSHSVHRNLSGMAIADITLLSGFEVEIEDLDKVSGSL